VRDLGDDVLAQEVEEFGLVDAAGSDPPGEPGRKLVMPQQGVAAD
jgi:hypothetical protein